MIRLAANLTPTLASNPGSMRDSRLSASLASSQEVRSSTLAACYDRTATATRRRRRGKRDKKTGIGTARTTRSTTGRKIRIVTWIGTTELVGLRPSAGT